MKLYFHITKHFSRIFSVKADRVVIVCVENILLYQWVKPKDILKQSKMLLMTGMKTNES